MIIEKSPFSKLILSPEMCPKTSKISLRFYESTILILDKKIKSFANYKCDTLILLQPIRKPSNKPLCSAPNINLLKTSTTMMNKNRKEDLLVLNLKMP